jgi:hypothetical protein
MVPTLRASDALTAAGSFYQIVASSTVWRSWPFWYDDVLLQWLLKQAPRVPFAEVQESSAEHKFILEWAVGKSGCFSAARHAHD